MYDGDLEELSEQTVTLDLGEGIEVEVEVVEAKGAVNDLVQRLFDLKMEKTVLNEQIKELESQIESATYSLISRMNELGVEKLSTSAGSVSKKVEIYPTVVDFQQFVTFCFENNRFDFLQKRVNTAPFKEFFEQQNEYPSGLDGYYKESLNTRKR